MKEISAGAILHTIKHNEVYYLLIKDFHSNWGFPKGHLENNETAIEAAIREVYEEVGIKVDIDSTFKEELNYVMPNGIDKTSIYYIGYFDNQVPKKQLEEVDEIKLLPYEQALDLLTFDNMKQVLSKAHKYIKKA